ncbi:MAG: tetratricopeptide repeat protein, partial [Candidatus Hodarchaeota archaeon]
PRLNHKRALYYSAKCSEQLDDWDTVKKYCRAYLELQPKDKDVWELLASAHKKLFEYEEAQDAMDEASKL